jgi:hypothetical protein
MRRWLLVLMIVLLPVRTWAGDVMALSMGMGMAPAAAGVVVAPCHGSLAAADSVDRAANHDHRAGPMSVADLDPEADGPLNDTCAACDVCNGPAMVVAMADVHAASCARPHVLRLVERFVSAEPQRAKKPPIA